LYPQLETANSSEIILQVLKPYEMGFLLLDQFLFSLSRNHITSQVAERKGRTEIDLASVTSVWIWNIYITLEANNTLKTYFLL